MIQILFFLCVNTKSDLKYDLQNNCGCSPFSSVCEEIRWEKLLHFFLLSHYAPCKRCVFWYFLLTCDELFTLLSSCMCVNIAIFTVQASAVRVWTGWPSQMSEVLFHVWTGAKRFLTCDTNLIIIFVCEQAEHVLLAKDLHVATYILKQRQILHCCSIIWLVQHYSYCHLMLIGPNLDHYQKEQPKLLSDWNVFHLQWRPTLYCPRHENI